MYYTEYDKSVLPLVLLVIVAFVAILALFLRKKSERVRAIPCAMVAVALLFIEIVKQRWNLIGEQGFDRFFLPFHYCSLFLIVFPLAELCGERLSRIFRPIATCMAFMVSVAMYVYPQGIMGNATESFGVAFKETHGFIFHHLVLLYFLLVVAMRLCRPRVRDAVRLGMIGVAYTAVALPLAYKLETNYCNFLESVIPVFENFRIEYGQDVYTVVLILFMTFGTMISAFVYIGVYTAGAKFFELCSPKKKKSSKNLPHT
ncbi:MAG: hypothetical protein E7679_04250 [Ruminococcaceae bacterium]|nr:hypothetical protein [Oscillospiraceae bacterium]